MSLWKSDREKRREARDLEKTEPEGGILGEIFGVAGELFNAAKADREEEREKWYAEFNEATPVKLRLELKETQRQLERRQRGEPILEDPLNIVNELVFARTDAELRRRISFLAERLEAKFLLQSEKPPGDRQLEAAQEDDQRDIRYKVGKRFEPLHTLKELTRETDRQLELNEKDTTISDAKRQRNRKLILKLSEEYEQEILEGGKGDIFER